MSHILAKTICHRINRDLSPRSLILMVLDGVEDAQPTDYVMLTVKKNILAVKVVSELRSTMNVPNAYIGMAFDYGLSLKSDRLVMIEDPSVNRIYVPLHEYANNEWVHAMLNG